MNQRRPFFDKADKVALALGALGFIGLIIGALTRTDGLAIGSFFLLFFSATWLHLA